MKTYRVIGLMSGTSLDGLDLCFAEFDYPVTTFEILHTETKNYDRSWRSKLRNATKIAAEELIKLDYEYGAYLGNSVNEFIQRNSIDQVDLIASHGHTIFHEPKEGYTLQIGKGASLYECTKIPVVYDFRSQDVAFGGEGAPLVPIGDELLFGSYESCLNLGGFSNISFCKFGKRIAFDICPLNIILNQLVEQLGLEYDKDGDLAKEGTVNFALLEKLEQLEYYQQIPPKSLGWEWCESQILPLLENSGESVPNLLATCVEHFSNQMANVLNENSISQTLVTGGGAYNAFLIKCIQAKTNSEIYLPNESIINYKEALIFALMGLLKLKEQINVYASVTGAKRDHISGILIQ